MKIGIVGGGIFGTSIAWMLAKNGFTVDLYEKNSDILQAASGINQYRIHRGYHYPRSEETVLSCLKGQPQFMREYGESMVKGVEHYYCISNKDSLRNAQQCAEIWDESNLKYEEVDNLAIVNKEKIEKCIKVDEGLFDPEKLRAIVWERLRKYGVNVLLNHEVKEEELEAYDLVVIATYSLNNTLLNKYPSAKKNYQFELCEKLVLKLPEKFNNKSVVIIDGPFMCIDPFGSTGYFVMGNVEHAIHKRMIGLVPEIPDEFKPLLNKGVIKNPPITNFPKFIESAKEFFPGIEEAEHIGSMYTIRTVPPYREHDDSRPTIIEQIDEKTIVVFSGKIPTCIDVAEQILEIAKKK